MLTIYRRHMKSCPHRSEGNTADAYESAVGDWQRSLVKLFRPAGVKNGHAHRFRDTFAVELLLAGVPLERVSMLLGHQSVKITERHYAPT
jgi:integrase